LVAIIVSIILFTIFYNLARSPYEALMADITPVEQRGRVMATSTLVSLIGQVVLLLLPIPIVPKFGLCALCMVVTTLYTCWRVREPEHPTEAKISHWQELRIALRGLPALPQAGKALFALFLAGLGIGAVFPFLTTFVVKITRSSVHEAESAMVVLMAACALTVLPFGKLTDQIGPKRVLQIGLGLTVLAALGGLWVTQLWHIWVLLAIAGVGNAAQSAARYPLLTEIVPAEEVGFYTGLQNTAMSLALPITSFVTGTLVNQGGYRVIFVVCAINVALAMAVVASVRLRAAAEEVARRNRAMGRS
jgi:MFS family permease